jgi:hypothetical protein
MDPNANLAEQLKLAARILDGAAPEEDAERLAELVLALDEWLRRSGGLPREWAPKLSGRLTHA